VKSSKPEWDGARPDIVEKNMTPCSDDVLKHTVGMSKLFAAEQLILT